jgi:3-dehydroquinate synthase
MIYSQSESKIIFTEKISEEIENIIKSAKAKVFILADDNTHKLCLPKIDKSLLKNVGVFCLKPGEQYKHIDSVVKVWEFLNKNGADRKSTLINLGGGVICDLGGFVASTFKRGIDFIQIPTTLLSQVDASVGGKTGINLNSYKNEIGCFSFPKKVIIDTTFLDTLDFENMLSGYAEMLKQAFISNEKYYSELKKINFSEGKLDYSYLLELVKHSVKIKENVVLADPMELGLRKILNFGHTVGHAFESFYMGTPDELSHGRAVAYGMAIELYLSHKKTGLPKEKLNESINYINQIYGKLNFQKSDYEKLVELMTHDKKNEAAKINFTLIEDIGKAVFDQTAVKEEILEGFEFYLSNW